MFKLVKSGINIGDDILKSAMSRNVGFAQERGVIPKINGMVTDTVQLSTKVKSSADVTKEVLEREIQSGKTRQEIADSLGLSYQAISRKVYAYKLETVPAFKSVDISDSVLRSQVESGMSLNEMAKIHDCCITTIRNKLKALGLKTAEADRVASVGKQQLEELVVAGADHKLIARRFGISEATVTCLLKKHGLETDATRSAKMITKQDVLDMYAAGADNSVLAEIFGISDAIMGKILRGFGLTNNQGYLTRLANDQIEISRKTLEKMLSQNLSKKEMAKELGTNVGRITRKLEEYGLAVKPQKVPRASTILPDNYTLNSLIHKEGMKLEEIAADYGVAVDALKRHLKKVGIAEPKQGKDIVETYGEALRKLASQGYKRSAIAEKLGISKYQVEQIADTLDINLNKVTNPSFKV